MTTHEKFELLLSHEKKENSPYRDVFRVATKDLMETSNLLKERGIMIIDADKRIDGDWSITVEK